jgi:hypothetical protein
VQKTDQRYETYDRREKFSKAVGDVYILAYIFICGLFNDDISNSYYIASDEE